MSELDQPGAPARRTLLHVLGGAGILAALSARHGAALAQGASGAQIVIDNFTFAPTPLAVSKGSTVTWVNHDDIPHSIVCPKLNLHSHAMDTDGTYANRFDRPGTYDYMCGLHPHMKGRIVVT
ncbi:MAG TPA: cupredoxin family copper-binding protein [Acetobacteraceae bacterium]|nr:cupredoxin family copper-binding protein [Acetobacteraceae bacterium]